MIYLAFIWIFLFCFILVLFNVSLNFNSMVFTFLSNYLIFVTNMSYLMVNTFKFFLDSDQTYLFKNYSNSSFFLFNVLLVDQNLIEKVLFNFFELSESFVNNFSNLSNINAVDFFKSEKFYQMYFSAINTYSENELLLFNSSEVFILKPRLSFFISSDFLILLFYSMFLEILFNNAFNITNNRGAKLNNLVSSLFNLATTLIILLLGVYLVLPFLFFIFFLKLINFNLPFINEQRVYIYINSLFIYEGFLNKSIYVISKEILFYTQNAKMYFFYLLNYLISLVIRYIKYCIHLFFTYVAVNKFMIFWRNLFKRWSYISLFLKTRINWLHNKLK